MVFIISTFGPTREYPDQEMMKKTLGAFLHSLDRQIDKNFKLFISCHDVPEIKEADLPFIIWCSMADGGGGGGTVISKKRPEKLDEPIEYEVLPFEAKMTDMSRKTDNSAMEAGHYAFKEKMDGFWMLRMDSDDLLANDHIAFLNALDPQKIQAVYNMTCHIFDPRRKEIAIHAYPYSTTCNAIYLKRDGVDLPRWFYLCFDHSKFMSQAGRDKIPAYSRDYALCIITNSGNSISERFGIDKESYCQRISMTKALEDRYGLEYF